MDATISRSTPRKLNKKKLAGRKHVSMSTTDSINDVSVIEWAEDIINGKRKATISKKL